MGKHEDIELFQIALITYTCTFVKSAIYTGQERSYGLELPAQSPAQVEQTGRSHATVIMYSLSFCIKSSDIYL